MSFYKNSCGNLKKKFVEILLRLSVWRGAKECQLCRSRKNMQNEHLVTILVAKIGADTAENETSKV